MTEDMMGKYKKMSGKKRQQEALKWYNGIVGGKISNVTSSNFAAYADETGLKGKIAPGYLQHFTYLAKHRKTLPYFDAFPLALSIDVGSNYFLSLNLHYLSYGVREKALKLLYDNITSSKSNTAKVKFNYQMMKEMSKYSFMKPAIKKHLFSQIKTKPTLILPKDFKHVVFLPSEDFIGATKHKVWSDSNKIIKKG